ncbi:MAG: threonylcarbamoyl-AMP synthase [Caedibacter sp. 38-128]|nr:threonylcarbamoyl-AMP synthase [Holosporales bacterium]OJX07035.1 MAG: threonylcarbamoyl-AMP synthase [Caedibacter sp. 38-128]
MNIPILEKAAYLLQQGNLVAIPTETVYGLAANAFLDQAVAKIYSLKNRPNFNPLIIHCKDLKMAQEIGIFNDYAFKLAEVFWPGPLTIVLPLNPNAPVSKLATAGLKTVALRIPAHPMTLKILELAGIPLAAPSANPSESISPTSASHVEKAFKKIDGLSMIIDGGACDVGLESTIIDLSEENPILLRPGKITRENLSSFIGEFSNNTLEARHPKAPGQLKRHYAPSIPLKMDVHEVNERQALLAFGPSPLLSAKKTLNLSPTADLIEAAANLFTMLHELDDSKFESIAVMPIPQQGIGIAINDRLSRAASS